MRKSYFLLALLLAGCSPSSTTDLKTYTSEEFGISIDSPYPIEFETAGEKDTLRTLEGRATNPVPKYVDIAKFVFRYLTQEKPTMDMFQMSLHAYRTTNKKNYDSKSILKGIIRNLSGVQKKGISDFQHREVSLQAGGMPATLLTGSFKIQKKEFSTPLYFQNLLIVRKNQYWRLYCAYQDGERYDELTNRIIKSIKITAK